jgi:hypothetical protein
MGTTPVIHISIMGKNTGKTMKALGKKTLTVNGIGGTKARPSREI